MFSLCTSLSCALPNKVNAYIHSTEHNFCVIFSFVCRTVTVERTIQTMSHKGLTLFLENTNCLLHRMYDIHLYFDILRNLRILEENVLLINQITLSWKLDK